MPQPTPFCLNEICLNQEFLLLRLMPRPILFIRYHLPRPILYILIKYISDLVNMDTLSCQANGVVDSVAQHTEHPQILSKLF